MFDNAIDPVSPIHVEIGDLTRALARGDLAAAEQHAAFILGALQRLRVARRREGAS